MFSNGNNMFNGLQEGLSSFAQMFGLDEPQQQQRATRQRSQQQNNQNNQSNQGQRPRQQQQQQQQQRPSQNQSFQRPTYTSSRRRTKKQENKQQPKQKEQVLNEGHALYWKDRGNQFYKLGRYEDAIKMYSKGISINDGHSILYSNRARCYKALGKFNQSLKNIQIAIDLDDKNIKAYLIQGQVLAELGKREDKNDKVELAIVKMTKALRLCTTLNKPQFKDDMNIYLLRAKKLLWYKSFNKLQKQKQICQQTYKNSIKLIPNITKQKYEQLLDIFKRSLAPSCTFVIPDNLCCKITYQLMEDPVIAESGHTYERSAIETHLKQNGKFDPFTRKEINGKLYPNLLVKTLIDDFLQQNPWAYQYSEGENYQTLKF